MQQETREPAAARNILDQVWSNETRWRMEPAWNVHTRTPMADAVIPPVTAQAPMTMAEPDVVPENIQDASGTSDPASSTTAPPGLTERELFERKQAERAQRLVQEDRRAKERERQRVLRQIREDRQRQHDRVHLASVTSHSGNAVSSSGSVTPQEFSSSSPSASTLPSSAVIQIRHRNGSVQRRTFALTDSVATVFAFAREGEHQDVQFQLQMAFPRRVFDVTADGGLSVREAGWTPNASLNVVVSSLAAFQAPAAAMPGVQRRVEQQDEGEEMDFDQQQANGDDDTMDIAPDDDGPPARPIDREQILRALQGRQERPDAMDVQEIATESDNESDSSSDSVDDAVGGRPVANRGAMAAAVLARLRAAELKQQAEFQAQLEKVATQKKHIPTLQQRCVDLCCGNSYCLTFAVSLLHIHRSDRCS